MKKVYLFTFSLLCIFSFYKVVNAAPIELKVGQSTDVPGEYYGADVSGITLSRNELGDTKVTCNREGTYTFNTTKTTILEFGSPIVTNYTYTIRCGSGIHEEQTIPTEKPEDQPTSETLKNFCDVNENPDVMRAFKMGGLALNILKIMIPILLIILGGIDFAQAVISSDGKQISKSTMKLVQRVIAGVVIFLVPTLVEYVFNLVDTSATNRYKSCYECLLDVSKCPEIPKVGENR